MALPIVLRKLQSTKSYLMKRHANRICSCSSSSSFIRFSSAAYGLSTLSIKMSLTVEAVQKLFEPLIAGDSMNFFTFCVDDEVVWTIGNPDNPQQQDLPFVWPVPGQAPYCYCAIAALAALQRRGT